MNKRKVLHALRQLKKNKGIVSTEVENIKNRDDVTIKSCCTVERCFLLFIALLFLLLLSAAVVTYIMHQPNYIPIGLVSCAVIIALIVCIIMCTKKHRKRERIRKQMLIQNAMVVLLPIAYYDEQPNNPDPDLEDLVLDDLPVENTIEQLHILFGDTLNYSIFPSYKDVKNIKLHWTQSEIIAVLQEQAVKFNETNTFDGLIVIISSHGIRDYICTSDYHLIEKTAIHRIFTTTYYKAREIPRIFIFDLTSGGDGAFEQQKNTSALKLKNDATKFTVNDIESEDSLWRRDTKHPDYKLVQITGSASGFQSKMDRNIGSYMLNAFVTRFLELETNNQHKYIYEIFDDIQEELHNRGKQHLMIAYNNNTRYVRLIKSDAKRLSVDEVKVNKQQHDNIKMTELVDIKEEAMDIQYDDNIKLFPKYNEDSCFVKECETVRRILNALKYYSSIKNQENGNTQLMEYCIQYKAILDDYIHIVTKHNNTSHLDEIYNILNVDYDFSECDINSCGFSLRHYRNRNIDKEK
eukprot:466869_1